MSLISKFEQFFTRVCSDSHFVFIDLACMKNVFKLNSENFRLNYMCKVKSLHTFISALIKMHNLDCEDVYS